MAKNRGICAAHTCIPQYREYTPRGVDHRANNTTSQFADLPFMPTDRSLSDAARLQTTQLTDPAFRTQRQVYNTEIKAVSRLYNY